MYDVVIVGQGIAGTLLAHFLMEEGKKIMVIDPNVEGTATKVAAGIINPVTGRRYVKSWKVDQLIPFAEETYQSLEKKFQIQFYHKRNIIRTLFNSREENDWLLRTAEPGYEKYMLDQAELGDYQNTTIPAYSYGEVRHAAQVNIGQLTAAYRKYLIDMNALREEVFDFNLLQVNGDQMKYKDLSAAQLVFCEGIGVKQNPFFNYLPFGGAKGEVLIVRIEGEFDFPKTLKHRVFIAPLGNKEYWIGATYDWSFENNKPTDIGGVFLEERLKDFLKLPFEIVTHKAAIRPTVKDRRPILGFHPEVPQLAIFNGLGTKGASLGPFWASHMAEVLDGAVIDSAVSIDRFDK